MSEKPGFYAIIPASVRYDDTLSPNAKLLYGEITALTSIKGYCWASNAYFARVYEVKPNAVSGWIKQLIEAGHIYSVIDSAEGNKRTLSIVAPIPKKGDSYTEKKVDPIPKKREHINTVNTTVINTEDNISEPPEAPRSPPPRKAQPKPKGDTRIADLITYYHDKYVEYAGTKPTVTGGWGKNFKLLLRNHDQDQIQHIIDYFFDYKGRTQYNFYTFFNKFDNLAPSALKTMPREDQSSSVLHKGDEGFEELKPTKFTGYQHVEGR